MITVPAGAARHLAMGPTDMRKGFRWAHNVGAGVLQDAFSRHLFVLRGKRGDLVKILCWDGQGFCLFANRLAKGRFVWPLTKEGSVTLTPAQLSMLAMGVAQC